MTTPMTKDEVLAVLERDAADAHSYRLSRRVPGVDDAVMKRQHESIEARATIAAWNVSPSADVVGWPKGVLNRDDTLRLLREHNAWRRGEPGEQTDARLLGLALDAAIAALSQLAQQGGESKE